MTSSLRARGWVEIDTATLAHNVRTIRAELGDTVEFCAVVKADAYGHGVDIVVPVLQAAGMKVIGVASNAEADRARRCGFPGRLIRVRPAAADEISEGVALGIEEWIGGPAHADVVRSVARRQRRPLAGHLSLNSTGLSRDGWDVGASGAADAVRRMFADESVDIVGVCTHFPREDAEDVRRGTAQFLLECSSVAPGTSSVTRHCATTYASLHVPESRLDMVRIGAGLYGDTSALDGALRPAMRVLSTVTAVNSYRRGSSVGYDRWHRLDHDATLALIPLGYADGFHRSLSGRGEVLVRGARARIVDRIAMNGFLVDVTHIPGVAPGDEVVLFGRSGAECITSDDVERSHGHIAADLYPSWGQLLPRVAVQPTG